VRNSLHQLADFRLQKLIRNDQRFERVAHVATARRNRLIRCRFKPVSAGLWIWRGTSALMGTLAVSTGSRNVVNRIKGDAALASARTKRPAPKAAANGSATLSGPKRLGVRHSP
jgi:hypothetical protein